MASAVKFIFELSFVFLFLGNGIESIVIDCEFRSNSEECKITSLKVPADTEVTSITGAHAFRKSNKDVKELWVVRDTQTEYVPTNFCKFFENLERVDFYGTKIKHISRAAFKNCPKINKVCILFTSLTSIPEDIFYDLSELRDLSLYENKLVMLPGNLIAKNLKLMTFTARNNSLLMIDVDFSSQLTKVDLTGNACIDKVFPAGGLTLSLLNKEILENCESPIKQFMSSKNEKLMQLEANVTAKDSEIKTLKEKSKFDQAIFTSNLMKLQIENAKLNFESGMRLKELEAMKTNSTAQITKVYDENISLKANVTTCQQEVDKKSKEIDEFKVSTVTYSDKAKTSQIEIDSLKANLSTTIDSLHSTQYTLEFVTAQNFNYNESLEECWQNLSSINEMNEYLEQKAVNFENKVMDIEKNCTKTMNALRQTLNETCKDSIAANLAYDSEKCAGKSEFTYYIFLCMAFAVIFAGTVIYLRRAAQRNLIKTMINYEVGADKLSTNI